MTLAGVVMGFAYGSTHATSFIIAVLARARDQENIFAKDEAPVTDTPPVKKPAPVAKGWKDYPSTAGKAAEGPKKNGTGAAFADNNKLQDHFARNGGDFGAKSASEYEAQADQFLTGPKSADVFEKVRPNGDVLRFNPNTNEFGVASPSNIRTYFKPDPAIHGYPTNLDYFNAQ